jgi:hypothetical protein
MAMRNLIVALLAELALACLTWAAQASADIFMTLHSSATDVVSALVVGVVSLAAFFAMRGGFWLRTAIVVAVPIVFGLVAGLVWSDDASLQIALGGTMAALAFGVCLVLAGPVFLWRKKRSA